MRGFGFRCGHYVAGVKRTRNGSANVAVFVTRERSAVALREGRRLLDTMGWAALLPLVLATLGGVFAASGVGEAVAVEPRLVGEVDGWLVEALATLSPQQRTALALRYVEDLDVRGIADRMGCSEGTVRSHLSRGTHRLKEHARGREQEPHA